MKYIPDLEERQVHNRNYVVTVLNSLKPEFVRQLVAHADKLRSQKKEGTTKLNELKLTAEF